MRTNWAVYSVRKTVSIGVNPSEVILIVPKATLDNLSRRERQIMDIIYREGRCTAQRVMEEMPDAPGYSTVRTLLGVLERKGYLRHERKSYHYEYFPVTPAAEIRGTALAHVMETFFQGSATRVVSALMDIAQDQLTDQDYQELKALIDKTKQEGD